MEYLLPLEINCRDHIGLKTPHSHCHQQICQGPYAHHPLSSLEHQIGAYYCGLYKSTGPMLSTRHLYEVCFTTGNELQGSHWPQDNLQPLSLANMPGPKSTPSQQLRPSYCGLYKCPSPRLWFCPIPRHLYEVYLPHEINHRDYIGLKTLHIHCHYQICQGPYAHHLSNSEPLVNFTSIQAQGYAVGSLTRHPYEVCFTTGNQLQGSHWPQNTLQPLSIATLQGPNSTQSEQIRASCGLHKCPRLRLWCGIIHKAHICVLPREINHRLQTVADYTNLQAQSLNVVLPPWHPWEVCFTTRNQLQGSHRFQNNQQPL